MPITSNGTRQTTHLNSNNRSTQSRAKPPLNRFSVLFEYDFTPWKRQNPRKTYFNPFTFFRFRGIKPSATATDKEIRTHHTNPEKTETTAHWQPKTQIKPEFLQKKNLNQTLSYSI